MLKSESKCKNNMLSVVLLGVSAIVRSCSFLFSRRSIKSVYDPFQCFSIVLYDLSACIFNRQSVEQISLGQSLVGCSVQLCDMTDCTIVNASECLLALCCFACRSAII